MDKVIVEAVKAYAKAHYNDGGWDVIVECWEDEDIADAVEGAKNAKQAISMLRRGVVAVWADRQADARNSAF
jgi:hypothetical protein